MATASVLDLTTDQDRAIVRIDSVPYELRRPTDLTLAQFKRLERTLPRVVALINQDELTDEDAAELEQRIATVAELALDAPADVHARLHDVQRVQIFQVFTQTSSRALEHAVRLLTATRRPPTSPRPGTTSSRASNASTAATRARGKPASRSTGSRRT